MSERAWRYLSLLLVVAVAILWWRDCHRPRGAGNAAHTAETSSRSARATRPGSRTHDRLRHAADAPGDDHAGAPSDEDPGEHWDVDEPPARGPSLTRQLADHWAVRFLTPRPGESVLDYRDRVVPVAQLAVAPHRTRVAEARRPR